MSFLKKFKYQYHSKQLEAFSNSKNYSEIVSYLENLSTEKKIFHDLSSSMLITQLINQHKMFQKNKLFGLTHS